MLARQDAKRSRGRSSPEHPQQSEPCAARVIQLSVQDGHVEHLDACAELRTCVEGLVWHSAELDQLDRGHKCGATTSRHPISDMQHCLAGLVKG